MQKKPQDFSKEDLMRVANSPAGKQLLAMLQQGDSAKLEQAKAQAQAGDFSSAGQALRTMLSSPEAQRLLKELGGK